MNYRTRPVPTNFRLNVTATMPDTGEQRRFPQPDPLVIPLHDGEVTHELWISAVFVGRFPAGTIGRDVWGEQDHLRYVATLEFQGRTLVTTYSTGIGISIYDSEMLRSIVHGLVLDQTDETFERWVDDYGYDTDSRNAHQIWEACVETELHLRQLLGNPYQSRLVELVESWDL
jgi:hypothetical protein